MFKLHTLIGALGVLGVAAASAGTAQASDLFRLENFGETQHVSYDSPRDVRICLDTHHAITSLTVTYEGGTDVIEPGSCTTFTAAGFNVKARGRMAEGWAMVGSGRDAASTTIASR